MRSLKYILLGTFLLTDALAAAQERAPLTRSRPNGAAVYPVRSSRPVADRARIEQLLAMDLPGGKFDPHDRAVDSVGRPGAIDLMMPTKSVQEVFRQLRISLRRNIVVDDDVKKTWGGDLYGVLPEEAIELICRGTGLVAKEHGSYIQISNAKMETRIFTVRHLPAVDAAALIKPALSTGEEGSSVTSSKDAATGLESGDGVTGGDAYANDGVLVITDYPANLDKVQEILDQIDQTPMQVMVEVIIIAATLGATEQMGVNFDALGGVNYQEYGATSTDGQSIRDNVFGSDQIDSGLQRFSTGLAGGLATRGSQFGYITSSVSAFVRALSEKTSVSIHANTSVSVVNKQFGTINLLSRDGFKTLLTTNGGNVSENVEYLETGSSFKVRPFIMDHGIVRMELQPEDSDGGINESGLPAEETANITSNVAVRDGQTLVIGGLFREKKVATNGKVPGLGDVPVIGAIFNSKNEQIMRQELIFLITPRIIDLESEAMSASANERHPHSRRGADRSVINELYARTARALVLESEYGCALTILEVARLNTEVDAKDKDLQARITYGLVPDFAGASVDQRILDGLKGLSRSNR
jgi:type IV pilus assembly protein PilQ